MVGAMGFVFLKPSWEKTWFQLTKTYLERLNGTTSEACLGFYGAKRKHVECFFWRGGGVSYVGCGGLLICCSGFMPCGRQLQGTGLDPCALNLMVKIYYFNKTVCYSLG